jgi:transposase
MKNTFVYPENLFNTLFPYGIDCDYTPEIGENLIKALGMSTISTHRINDRFKAIIEARYKDGLTYQKIADRFGISSSRIQQIEAKGLRMLRHPKGVYFIKNGKEKPEVKEFKPVRFDEFWQMNGSLMDFPTFKKISRIETICKREGLITFEDILDLSKEKLYKIRGLGQESINSIVEYFEALGVNVDKFKN